MSLIGSAISSAATSAVLESARAKKNEATAKLSTEKQNAQQSAKSMNSIFDNAKSSINADNTKAGEVKTNAETKIEASKKEAVDAGTANKDIKKAIDTANQLITQYTNELKAKQKEQADLKQQIEQLGGEVQNQGNDKGNTGVANDSAQPEPANTGESKGTGKSKGAGTTQKTKSTKKSGSTSGGNKSEKLANLQAKYKEVSGQVQTLQNDKIKGQTDIIAENTPKYEANIETVKTKNTEMKQTADSSSQNLSSIAKNISNTGTKANQQLQNDIKKETTSATNNAKESGTLMVESQKAKAAANKADSDDPNKSALEQISTDLKKLSTDFGLQNGVAKQNKDNVTKGTNYSTSISNLVMDTAGQNIQNLSSEIYKIYQDALKETAEYATNQIKDSGGGGSGGKIDLKALGGSVESNAMSMVSNLTGGISTGSEIGDAVLGAAMDVGMSLLGGLF